MSRQVARAMPFEDRWAQVPPGQGGGNPGGNRIWSTPNVGRLRWTLIRRHPI